MLFGIGKEVSRQWRGRNKILWRKGRKGEEASVREKGVGKATGRGYKHQEENEETDGKTESKRKATGEKKQYEERKAIQGKQR